MTEFDDATQVDPTGSACIEPGWDIGGHANGGYLIALAARHLRAVAGRPDPITLTAHFLAPGTPGPVAIDGEVLKAGRRLVTVSGAVRRDGRPMMHLLGAFGDLADDPVAAGGGFEWHASGPPDLPPMDDCVLRAKRPGIPVPLLDRIDVRLRPADAGFATGQRSGVAEVAGYLAFDDGRPWDTLGLLFACDALPPAVFNIDMPEGWVPTVELTVHVRGVPRPGPLRCAFVTRHVSGGRFETDGEVWDSGGRLVALSRQMAMVPR